MKESFLAVQTSQQKETFFQPLLLPMEEYVEANLAKEEPHSYSLTFDDEVDRITHELEITHDSLRAHKRHFETQKCILINSMES